MSFLKFILNYLIVAELQNYIDFIVTYDITEQQMYLNKALGNQTSNIKVTWTADSSLRWMSPFFMYPSVKSIHVIDLQNDIK